jgi:hypothetical protein
MEECFAGSDTAAGRATWTQGSGSDLARPHLSKHRVRVRSEQVAGRFAPRDGQVVDER